MITEQDKERLEAAQQAIDLAHKAIVELYKADNPLLSEHGYSMIEPLSIINQKLKRLLSITIRR